MHKIIGWRECLGFPELGINRIKAKIDTGARTSTIHTFEVVEFERDGARHVRFGVHPSQYDDEQEIWCESPITDQRLVRDSGGHEQERFVIETPISLGGDVWKVELTLTNRDNMGFRVLLGRTAFIHRYVVDVSQSFVLGYAALETETPP